MAVDLIVKNGRLVSPFGISSGAIAVDKGKVVALGEEPLLPPGERVIDAQGRYILPGVVDPHVHLGFLEQKAAEEKSGVESDAPLDFLKAMEVGSESETQAAAGGGVTTMGVFIPFMPREGLLKSFDQIRSLYEANACVDSFFHVFVRDELGLEEVDKMPQKGVTSFKFSIGYKGPQAEKLGFPPVDDGFFFDGFERIGRLGRPVWSLVHAENIDIALRLRERIIKAGRTDLRAWHDSRPHFVEAECMRRCIYLARIANCPLYNVHMTIGDGVDIVAQAKSEGSELIAETCPQYLTHNSEEPMAMLRDHPALGNVNPPLRDKKDNERLWQGIRDGVIDCVGSDHSVKTVKQSGKDIWKAPMGLGNLTETLLPVMLSEGVSKGRITLEKVAEVCCANPAKVFGIYPKKGAIAVGSDADLVIVDMERKVKVTWKMLHSICDWTIYEGREFKGWPVMTILRGQVIMEEGKVVGQRGFGQYIPREVK